jgi:hypothetical protein
MKKLMTFKQAKKKLDHIAKGRFRTIKYELMVHEDYRKDGNPESEANCTLYIDGYSHAYDKTWEEAFVKLQDMLNPPKAMTETEALSIAPH